MLNRFEQLINPGEYRSILCLDGALPEVDFFQSGLPVIAADGAANSLMNMGITPDIVIGDLDSVLPVHRDVLKTHYHYDQNFCDFEKSLSYLEANQLLPSIIVGVNGGFLDHILNNINIFMRSSHFLYAPPLAGFVIRGGETKSLTLPIDTKLSVFGIPNAVLSTAGLKWNLTEAPLSFPGKNSCFNRTITEKIELQVTNGSILLLIYQ